MPSARRGAQALHTPGGIITYARSNHYIRQGVWATHGPNAPKRRHLGTISAKLLMYLDENLPTERLNAPHLDAIRAQRSTSITYARWNHYMRQVDLLHTPGCVDNPGLNAPKRRYLGTISAKLLMYLDENLPTERLNAPHLDAIRAQRSTSITYARWNHYMRQVDLLHTPGCVDNPGLNAPKRRYLGTISAKLLMYLDENLPTERLNAPHLDAIRAQRSTSITYARWNHYIRQGVWATHGPNAPKRRYLGTISAKLLMYLDENLPTERLNAPHLDAIRAQRSTSITYARWNHYIRQGVWATHGPNAPKRRHLGTVSAKLLMYLDENLPTERLNAPHLDAIRAQRSTSITYARWNHYMRQVDLLHTPGCVDNPGLNAPKRRYLGTISAKLLMYLDENLPTERLNAPHLDAIRAQRSTSITYARWNHYMRQVDLLHTPGCVDNPGLNAPKRRYLGTISAKLLMYLDENLPTERLNAPHLDAIRAQRSTSITYARWNHYIRQGVWATHGPNAPKRRYLGTISAKLLMYLDENLPTERLNAPHLDAIRAQRSTSITYARWNHYIRQGVWATHGPNAPKRRHLGTVSAKLLMYLDENLPTERLNAPHLDAIRAQRSTSITYARSN